MCQLEPCAPLLGLIPWPTLACMGVPLSEARGDLCRRSSLGPLAALDNTLSRCLPPCCKVKVTQINERQLSPIEMSMNNRRVHGYDLPHLPRHSLLTFCTRHSQAYVSSAD